eukprot:11424490-Ditylum_brightwellii.AAC.1
MPDLFTLICIYHCIAMLYYMGVMSFLLKGDYWSSHPCMPKHFVMTELGMPFSHFYSMWQHFCLYKREDIKVEEEEGNEKDHTSKEEDMINELYLECVVHNEEEDECESDEEDKEDAGESDEGSSGEIK